MHTLLNKFCEDFDAIVRPVLDPIASAVQAIEAASEHPVPGRGLKSDVIELKLQLEQLVEKVSEQQAYVLIFGPLKSGKSTLMNALCASYVSEVSSLPAYPCMVFVSHAPSREFTVTLYNGHEQIFRDEIALHAMMHRAHGELADEMRRVELAGGQFDPVEHLPTAIRRIDVKLPAGDLEQSGAVLVDTPGLYSRMKFGYDRMTREFRNAAACAIFVVKSDNLFLEQVFSEFTDLLDLFSKIFLIVNLDVTKRDLGIDGKLVPSLESHDPMRIIDAFERLAMSAPLKEAAEDGRLKIFPVGLLSAAQSRLKSASDPKQAEQEASNLAGFTPFMDELTDYLNSPDYLVAFLGDSIHRASTLLHETRNLGADPDVQALAREVEDYDRQLALATGSAESSERLLKYPWADQLQKLRLSMQRDVLQRAGSIDEKTQSALEGTIGRWFETAASLEGLTHDELQPLFVGYQEEAILTVQKILSEKVSTGHGGVRLPEDVAADLRRANIDIPSIARRVVQKIDTESLVVLPPRAVQTKDIPVRRRIWDWLRFRSTAKLRDLVFGPEKRPNLRIPQDLKASRLGSDGKRSIVEQVDAFQEEFCFTTKKRLNDHFFGTYTQRLNEEIKAAAKNAHDVAKQRELELAGEVEMRRSVLKPLTAMRDQAQNALRKTEALSEQYRATDPKDLLRPIAPEPEAAKETPTPKAKIEPKTIDEPQ